MGSVDNDRNRRRVAVDGGGGNVVRGAAQTHGILGRERVGSGRGQGEDRHVDALGVHGRDSACTEVLQALLMVAHLVEGEALVAGRGMALERGRQIRHDPVFFDGDERHGSILSSAAPLVGPTADGQRRQLPKPSARRAAVPEDPRMSCAGSPTRTARFAAENPAIYDEMFTRATQLRFGTEDTPVELSAGFAELREAVTGVAGGRDVDTLTEVLWAALHGLTTLGRDGRLRPSHDTERIELLVAQFYDASSQKP